MGRLIEAGGGCVDGVFYDYEFESFCRLKCGWIKSRHYGRI